MTLSGPIINNAGCKGLTWPQAVNLIPNGTQTLSKCPDRYVNGVYPKFIVSGNGSAVMGDDGKCYTDFIAGLGPILLGYRFHSVDSAVMRSIEAGEVLFSLPHPKEAALAAILHNNISCAQQSKFFKTGSEALSAAVRVARAYTGKDKVLICGYHGWHDWYTIVNDKKAGIPSVLSQFIQKFKYNDLEGLRDSFQKDDIAALILEPVVYEEPKDDFLKEVIRMAHEHSALVVFDEVVTGFRFGCSGASGYFNVQPDLACFSKAMGNGYPIAALCGLKEYMSVFERDDFFVSGTFGGDLIGISAAIRVFEQLRIRDEAKIKHIWNMGTRFRDGFNDICKLMDLEEVSCVGYAPRTMFKFPTAEHKALFWQECIKQGILFGYANFIMYMHLPSVIEGALQICEMSLRKVKMAWNDPKSELEGDVPKEVFRLT